MCDGTLIAIEGIDGAGKTAATKAVRKAVDETPLLTMEPTTEWTGRMARASIEQHDNNPLSDFFMFCADRAEHVRERIVPHLDDGKTVITDRYVDSTRAYQTPKVANALGVSLADAAEWVEDVFAAWNLEPDVVVYVDVPPEVGMQRCTNDDKFESIGTLREARQMYHYMYGPDTEYFTTDEMPIAQRDTDVLWVDGTQPKHEVARDIRSRLPPMLDDQ